MRKTLEWIVLMTLVFAGGVAVGRWTEPLGSIRLWAITHDPHRQNSVDMHDVSLFELELRKRVGAELATVTPQIGGCWICRTPWSMVGGHVVEYERGKGRFAVCSECWRRLRNLGRDEELVQAYIDDAKQYDPSAAHTIGDAVRAELIGKPLFTSPFAK